MASARLRKAAMYCLVASGGQAVIVRMPTKFVPWSTLRKAIGASLRRHHGILSKDIRSIEAVAGRVGGDDDDGSLAEICERAFAGDGMLLRPFALHAWTDARAGFEMVRQSTEAPDDVKKSLGRPRTATNQSKEMN